MLFQIQDSTLWGPPLFNSSLFTLLRNNDNFTSSSVEGLSGFMERRRFLWDRFWKQERSFALFRARRLLLAHDPLHTLHQEKLTTTPAQQRSNYMQISIAFDIRCRANAATQVWEAKSRRAKTTFGAHGKMRAADMIYIELCFIGALNRAGTCAGSPTQQQRDWCGCHVSSVGNKCGMCVVHGPHGIWH
jgi:hypothetical protein